LRPKYVTCDPAACTGCRLCEFACAINKEGSYDLDLARIRVARPEPTLSIAVACRLCPDAPCVRACPRAALKVSPDDGVIEVIPSLCTGCGWCIEACGFGAVSLDRRSKCVVICDLCRDTGDPACIRGCPKQALSLRSVESLAAESRDRLAAREA
jgi:Fe-S-cluster-containing hydrogenase component 2